MKKPQLFILLGIGVLLIGGVVLAWQKSNQKLPQNQTKEEKVVENSDTDQSDTSEWKTYRNEEIGIEFEYPAAWGKITEIKEVGCIDFEGNPDKDLLEMKDGCLHISLATQTRGVFLSTESPSYTKSKISRGADWTYRLVSVEKMKEDFCLTNPYLPMNSQKRRLDNCEVFKTKNNITVTSGIREVPFMENKKMTAYFIRSSHPIYYDIVLSAEYLPSVGILVSEADMKKLVESLRFLK